LLALTSNCFDFDRKTLQIKNSYYRMNGRDVIGETKTEASKRTIVIPDILAEEIKEYIGSLYNIQDDMRIFQLSKSSLYRVMEKGCQLSGVKRIPIHSLRHSHISLLQNSISCATIMDIAKRAGQASTNITMIYSHRYKDTDSQIAQELNMLMEEKENVSKE